MTRPATWAVLLVLALGTSAAGQDTEPSLVERILAAVLLPEATQEARVLGVPDVDLRAILSTSRERDMSPTAVREIFVQCNDAVREHGPIDNFGAFVQQKLGQGLRGRELSDAIRAEHARRGIGKGRDLRQGEEHHGEHRDAPGKSDDRGEGKGGGR